MTFKRFPSLKCIASQHLNNKSMCELDKIPHIDSEYQLRRVSSFGVIENQSHANRN